MRGMDETVCEATERMLSSRSAHRPVNIYNAQACYVQARQWRGAKYVQSCDDTQPYKRRGVSRGCLLVCMYDTELRLRCGSGRATRLTVWRPRPQAPPGRAAVASLWRAAACEARQRLSNGRDAAAAAAPAAGE